MSYPINITLHGPLFGQNLGIPSITGVLFCGW